MINLNQISIRRGGKLLLENLSFTIHVGNRVGIVGRNGSGKSSLFALLRAELTADSGEVQIPENLSVASVRQEEPGGDQAAIEYVLDGDTQLRKIEADLAQAEADVNVAKQAHLHDQMFAIDGYAARSRAARMLYGLGFTAEVQENPISAFSGGWRRRLNLAQALMRRAELMLLDEPTNHLDLDAVLWLQGFLREYPGTLLVISHDRDFLDATTSHTLHLEGQTAKIYTGNYSAFEAIRAEQLALQEAQYASQQKRLAHMQKFVDRFRAKASKATQAQSRLKKMEKMQVTQPAHWDAPFSFQFAQPKREPTWLLRLDEASVGYDGVAIVEDIKLILAPGDRIALLGRNGAGKSTVMQLLAGHLQAMAGEEQRDRYLNVGYFAQHQLEHLDHTASALDHIQKLDPRAGERDIRNFLGGFDFRGDKALEPIAPFSGGEKARLALACIVYEKPNLLLLDEPTNHLDLEMRHALEFALQEFTGAVVVVAHDRHLIDATCDELWRVADGHCRAFDGDLDDYAKWLRKQSNNAESDNQAKAKAAKKAAKAPKTVSNNKDVRRDAAQQREFEKPLRAALKKAEREIEQTQKKLTTVEQKLADPKLYEGSNDELTRLLREQGELSKQKEAAETVWLENTERLES